MSYRRFADAVELAKRPSPTETIRLDGIELTASGTVDLRAAGTELRAKAHAWLSRGAK